MIYRWGCNTKSLIRFTLCRTQMQLLKPHCIDNLDFLFIIEVKTVNEEIGTIIYNQEILCLKLCFLSYVCSCVCAQSSVCTWRWEGIILTSPFTLSTVWDPETDPEFSCMPCECLCLLIHLTSFKIFINRLYSLTLHGAYCQVVSSTHTHCNNIT